MRNYCAWEEHATCECRNSESLHARVVSSHKTPIAVYMRLLVHCMRRLANPFYNLQPSLNDDEAEGAAKPTRADRYASSSMTSVPAFHIREICSDALRVLLAYIQCYSVCMRRLEKCAAISPSTPSRWNSVYCRPVKLPFVYPPPPSCSVSLPQRSAAYSLHS